MPRGKFTNHKGRNRKFTSPEELEEQRKQDEHKKWRKNKDGSDSDESDASGDKSGSGSDDESDSDSDDQGKAKGVSGLIEIENPNRVQKKSKKLTKIDVAEVEAPQLSRREREEIEKQRAAAAYQKAHAEGRTDQARADLARLAIIKQQREEAAKKREAEKKAKEEATKKR